MATLTATRIVPPSINRWETGMLVLAIAGMALFTGIYADTYGLEEKEQEILDWQISAYDGLQGVDQAIYNELLVAADEIYYMNYYDGYWPMDADFQNAFLPPFYRDLSWERNGSVTWTLKDVIQEGEAQGLTLYHGGGGTVEGQGAFLLIIDHKHAGNSQINGSSIWWHADPNVAVPETSKITSIVLHGWKQVVPYFGRDEVERLNQG